MARTSDAARARIWAAFIGLRTFLRQEIWDAIQGKTVVNVKEWTPIFNAARVADEEEVNASPQVVSAMKAALQGVEHDLNAFLAVLREFVANKARHDEAYWLQALNQKVNVARANYEVALETLKRSFDEGAADSPAQVSILFLAADPSDESRLRLGAEFREIHEKLRLSRQRDHFRLELPQLALRPQDLSQALLDTRPQIVHFSGHGEQSGALCFENAVGEGKPVEAAALSMLFSHFAGDVKCVVLNACYSALQAKAIAEHIPFVIGMSKAIGDDAAVAFAIGFYQALCAGQSVEEAYGLGCAQIALQGIPEHLTPVLIKKA